MRNKILKILWLSVFICGDVFSSDYNIQIKNHLQQPIELSRVAATKLEPRTIKIVNFSNRESSHCLKKETLEAGKSLDLGIDARAYFEDEGESLDSVVLTLNDETVHCVLKERKGNGFVYPNLSASDIFGGVQVYSLSNGTICTLTKDRRGPNFTLTIGTPKQSPNNSAISQQFAY